MCGFYFEFCGERYVDEAPRLGCPADVPWRKDGIGIETLVAKIHILEYIYQLWCLHCDSNIMMMIIAITQYIYLHIIYDAFRLPRCCSRCNKNGEMCFFRV